MLSLALALTATTTWTYAGFVADPPPPPAPPVSAQAAPPVLSASIIPAAFSPGRVAAPLPPPPALPATIRYRLPDASGQLWEHDDPAALQAFVLERNSRLFVPTYRVLPFVRPSRR